MKELLLIALLSLANYECRAQQTFGQHAFVGNWTYYVITEPEGKSKMAFTESDMLHFDVGDAKTNFVLILNEHGHIEISLQNKVGFFTSDPIGDSVSLRIDDGPYQQWKIEHTKNGQHIIFIQNASMFYHNLPGAQKLFVRALFDDGPKWMVINISGFTMNTLRIKDSTW